MPRKKNIETKNNETTKELKSYIDPMPIIENNEIIEENKKQNKNIETKNIQILSKLQKPAQEILEKQQEIKKISAQTVLNKYYDHNEDEYQEHLKKLRATDFVMTAKKRLRNVKIPGHKTIWASTDPKASKSIQDFKNDGYHIVKDIELIETGSSSVEGSGFHILMACPEDIAEKRKIGFKKMADEQFNRVLEKKIEHKGASNSYLYEKNTLDEDFSF